MTVKTNQSMIQRFTGSAGKSRLITCIARQAIVGGDTAIAKEFVRYGTLLEVRRGKTIIEQGESDNELYFIVSGSVSVSVNGREVATRTATDHFGEMALVDSTKRRSATVTTKEPCTFLKVTEVIFSRIAEKTPLVWRRTAVSLSSRLHERNKFHALPHSEPIVFIGSSSEALEPAQAIFKSLDKRPAIVKLWTDGIFQASQTTIEDLLKTAANSDFSIIVLSPDDVGISRGIKKRIPRDNAVFELGLFMGAIGRERSFIVTPDDNDIKIPTDLLGVKCMRYKHAGSNSIGRRLQAVCKELWHTIDSLGPR